MTTSYHEDALSVNPLHLTKALRRTLQLLISLAEDTGACYAGNDYLADKLGVNVSTVKRRLAQLRALKMIRSRRGGHGIRRRIYILRPGCALNAPQPPYKEESEETATAPPPPAPAPPPETPGQPAEQSVVVSALVSAGVSRLQALRMAPGLPVERVQAVIGRMRQAKPRNPAGWLICALRDGYEWGPPPDSVMYRERIVRREEEVTDADRRAFAGLSGEEQARWLARAESEPGVRAFRAGGGLWLSLIHI